MGIGKSLGKLAVRGAINTAINSGTSAVVNKAANSHFNTPKLDVKMGNEALSLPFGLDNYISKPLKDTAATLGATMPKEINGVPLPQMPDLTKVADKVDGTLKKVGLDTEALGLRDVRSILQNPDLNELKQVQWAEPVDMSKLPKPNDIMNSINLSDIEEQFNKPAPLPYMGEMPDFKDVPGFNEIPGLKDVPGLDSIDIHKFF